LACNLSQPAQDFIMRRLFFILWLPLIALLASGCMTRKLWTESKLDEWNEPAPNPNLHLFRAENPDHVLVVYDEFSDRHETTRTRAFFLEATNFTPVRPQFVALNSAAGLAPVPVFFHAPTNFVASFYEVNSASGFTLFSNGRTNGPYLLPIYDDGLGRWEKTAWTPVAVTLDLSIIGGAVGCVWISAGGPGLGR
jgi:hypothetical protein